MRGYLSRCRSASGFVVLVALLFFSAGHSYICARQNGVALPVELENMTIAVNEQGLPRSFGLLNGGRACDALDVMDVISHVAKIT